MPKPDLTIFPEGAVEKIHFYKYVLCGKENVGGLAVNRDSGGGYVITRKDCKRLYKVIGELLSSTSRKVIHKIIHKEKSPLAGKSVSLKKNIRCPKDFRGGSKVEIEDWWDRISGGSWKVEYNNPDCYYYAWRAGLSKLHIPVDDEVLYGKIKGKNYLIHITELDLPLQKKRRVKK